jgi:hypothetical protein
MHPAELPAEGERVRWRYRWPWDPPGAVRVETGTVQWAAADVVMVIPDVGPACRWQLRPGTVEKLEVEACPQ